MKKKTSYVQVRMNLIQERKYKSYESMSTQKITQMSNKQQLYNQTMYTNKARNKIK